MNTILQTYQSILYVGKIDVVVKCSPFVFSSEKWSIVKGADRHVSLIKNNIPCDLNQSTSGFLFLNIS